MTQKEKTFLDQTAQRLHLTVDGESSILFGSVGGYQTMLWRNDQGLAVMTLSLHKLGQEPDQSAIRQFVKGTRLVTGVSVRRSRVELTLNVRFGNPNQVEKLAEAVAAVVEFLHASGYDNCCQNCGSAVETDPCIMTGVPSLLCDSCYQQLGHLQEQNWARRRTWWPAPWVRCWVLCWAWRASCCWASWATWRQSAVSSWPSAP